MTELRAEIRALREEIGRLGEKPSASRDGSEP